MTISAPTFQRLQTGVTSADDLRVRNPVNAALAWLSGGLVTQLNTHFGAVSQSVSVQIAAFVAARPKFMAHKNGVSQVSISATATPVTFDTEHFDVGGHYDTTTSGYTPPSGHVHLVASALFTGTSAVDGETLELRITKNGAAYARATVLRPGAGAHAVGTVSAIAAANGTDTFAVVATKSGAGTGAIQGNSFDTWFGAAML